MVCRNESIFPTELREAMPVDLASGKWKIVEVVNDGVAKGVAKGGSGCLNQLPMNERRLTTLNTDGTWFA
jgi:hypothetical protein